MSTDPAQLKITDLAQQFRQDLRLEGLVVAFPDRFGGVSEAPFDSLNLGFSTGDDPGAVLENRRRLIGALNISPESVIVPGQVHGCEVLHATEHDAGEGFAGPSKKLAGHDVVCIESPGIFALSLTADCPLVTVIDPRERRVGIAHCGWRGTAAGALRPLLDFSGSTSDLFAVISPGIRGPQYVVGSEVIEAVSPLPGAQQAISGNTLDITTILLQTLLQAGLSMDRIALDPRCSHQDSHLFSYRRDRGETGRGGCLVGWKF
ncbi:MAG: hypothetical protein CBC13_06730 [Planctomycetia bacterium TMED53]|nr:MAG: hypothetical protein CBC13_06730 [Planctomycetia bacterium TMED53]